MKKIPAKMQVIDATGKVTEKGMEWNLLPPDPLACQVCGMLPAHYPSQPHDAASLYYQYSFYGEHGRWPTWKDAIAHCSEEVREAWERELKMRGKWTEPPN